jgi:hypothetical protein
MATGMRVEDRLKGSRNFRSWKHRLQMILDENDLLEHVTMGVPEPDEEEQKTKHKKNEKKAKRIVSDSVKDHLIPHISELQTARQMYEALSRLYESKDISRNLTLRNQLCNMKMDNSESVTSYLMRVSQIRDQRAAFGDVISDKELVTTTLNGFPTFWIPFVQGVCARSKLPKFDKLWADCTHEESRLADQHKRLIVDEEEALIAQKNKRSSLRKNNKEANSVRVPDKKKDVSMIRCYNCQKLGHFSYDCPQGRGKKKYQAHVAEEEESPPSKKALAEIKDYVL